VGAKLTNITPATFQYADKKDFVANEVEFDVLGNHDYKVQINCNHSAGAVIKLELNNDSTTAHYMRQNLDANDASISGGRTGDNTIFFAGTTSNTAEGKIWINKQSNICIYDFDCILNITNAPLYQKTVGSKLDATMTEITNIKLVCATGTLIGNVLLYRVINNG
jgi:hypothetical protein